jgi:hypothetical protein
MLPDADVIVPPDELKYTPVFPIPDPVAVPVTRISPVVEEMVDPVLAVRTPYALVEAPSDPVPLIVMGPEVVDITEPSIAMPTPEVP